LKDSSKIYQKFFNFQKLFAQKERLPKAISVRKIRLYFFEKLLKLNFRLKKRSQAGG